MPNSLLCLTALALGVRHGLDFDHVTAIADLVGSRVGAVAYEAVQTISGRSAKLQSCALGAAYAGGHAAVVAILGMSALCFCTVLPAWLDPIMEKLVGITLLLLGGWMLFSLLKAGSENGKVVLRSRGMVLLTAMNALRLWLKRSVGKRNKLVHVHHVPKVCDWKCAASIGAIHGIGAETGTQVLLITSLAGVGNLCVSLLMLSCFLLGMLLSSIALAVIVSEGYYRALVSSRCLVLVGVTVASLSVLTGVLMIIGRADLLPSLDSILHH